MEADRTRDKLKKQKLRYTLSERFCALFLLFNPITLDHRKTPVRARIRRPFFYTAGKVCMLLHKTLDIMLQSLLQLDIDPFFDAFAHAVAIHHLRK